jgi:site-specific recombinase XerD
MPRTKSIPLYWGIRYYLKYCQEKQLTPKTQRWYEQKLTLFRSYLAGQYHVASLASITEKHVEAFFMALESEISPATMKGYRQVLKGLFRWCVKQGLLENSPMKSVAAATRDHVGAV